MPLRRGLATSCAPGPTATLPSTRLCKRFRGMMSLQWMRHHAGSRRPGAPTQCPAAMSSETPRPVARVRLLSRQRGRRQGATDRGQHRAARRIAANSCGVHESAVWGSTVSTLKCLWTGISTLDWPPLEGGGFFFAIGGSLAHALVRLASITEPVRRADPSTARIRRHAGLSSWSWERRQRSLGPTVSMPAVELPTRFERVGNPPALQGGDLPRKRRRRSP